MSEARDYPLDECARAAAKLVSEGWTVHQKFTCVWCAARVRRWGRRTSSTSPEVARSADESRTSASADATTF